MQGRTLNVDVYMVGDTVMCSRAAKVGRECEAKHHPNEQKDEWRSQLSSEI